MVLAPTPVRRRRSFSGSAPEFQGTAAAGLPSIAGTARLIDRQVPPEANIGAGLTNVGADLIEEGRSDRMAAIAAYLTRSETELDEFLDGIERETQADEEAFNQRTAAARQGWVSQFSGDARDQAGLIFDTKVSQRRRGVRDRAWQQQRAATKETLLVGADRAQRLAEAAIREGDLETATFEAAKFEALRVALFGDGHITAAQAARHGVNERGARFANTQAWDDAGAVEAFRVALVREVDTTIVTPGQDKPLFMSRELGKTIFQFRTFAISSMQRTLISGLQRRDMATVQGAVLMTALGMLGYYLTNQLAGRPISDNPTVWLTEGLDRSGLFGWLFEANNVVEKVTRGNVGVLPLVSTMTGEDVPLMSRYASRNTVGALLGPSFGTATEAVSVLGNSFAGDWTATDTRSARKLLPFQNLFYIRTVLNDAEQGINSVMGVPTR